MREFWTMGSKRWRLVVLTLLVTVMLALIGCADKAIPGRETSESQAADSSLAAQAENESEETPPVASPTSIDGSSSSEDAPTLQPTEAASAPVSPESEASPTASPEADNSGKQTQEQSAEPSPRVETVTIAIIGNEEWGTILAAESVTLKAKDTAADVLKRAAKAHRLAYEIRGSGAMTYIEGIDGLYEFDDGPTSGWKFRVNGKVLDVGAGSYAMKAGDKLEWFYASEDEAAKENEEINP